ncbi:MAG: hypothetical protein H8E42_01930 [Nitrospinae bacterium]|nr:hypothetical protein [Nitrospinota bacterium]MBL7019712.1 hypothetical protein [Nitrospinaceae bacterium]
MNKQKTEIVRLLKHKQEICTRLLKKLGEQMKVVDIQDNSRLAAIIEEKEGLIAGLTETDQKIADLASDLDQAILESLGHENEELAHRIESDLEKIIEQETVCQEKLSLVKSEVLEKIKTAKRGQTLLKGYGVSQRINPKISKNI